MNNLFRSITLLLLMFILGSVSAQNKSLNVKGTVRDAMGDPIIGATIYSKVQLMEPFLIRMENFHYLFPTNQYLRFLL